MEIIAEIIIQILLWILQLGGELILQIIGEAIAELIGHSIKEPFRRPEPIHPWLALVGYAIFGSLAGGLSLWLLPKLYIEPHWLRLINLALSPLIAGLLMAWIGRVRRRHGKDVIRLDSFAYGFFFALFMGLVRFTWGH
jgi:hypothetical protein